MIPTVLPITIRRGDTFRQGFRIRKRNPDGTVGDYVDLTNWGPGLAQVRIDYDAPVLFDMTITKGNQLAFPGFVLLTIPDDVTAAADFTPEMVDKKFRGKWDFEIANDLGEKDTYIEGDVKFTLDVSRP